MRTFKRYTLAEYVEHLKQYVGKVKFSEVHVHHTWKPTKASWRASTSGEKVMLGMYNAHKGRDFSDIAQHATIDPDGFIWDGRSLLMPPASATGHNDPDSDNIHPFMFEMIGNFDTGMERLEGDQLVAVIGLTKAIMQMWQLPESAVRFHREMQSGKSCPGTGITKDWFLSQLKEDERVLKVEDANKIITLLGAVWQVTDTPESTNAGQNEAARLANECRKASGQPTI